MSATEIVANPNATALQASSAITWPPLRRLLASEAMLGRRIERSRWTSALYEFLRFGLKQGWACLFGGIAVGLMILTAWLYPAQAPLSRYDFLFLSLSGVQVALLAFRLETRIEAKVILIYHAVGTGMEIFKTSVGSWIYPEPSLFHLAGVPLFTGFMYSCIGSYICRAWRLFDFRFNHHPPRWSLVVFSLLIYANFFGDHYGVDLRLPLFVIAALSVGRTTIYFRVWRVYRSMPLLIGLVLVSLFIWFSENIGTYSRIWLYPSQHGAWSMVSPAKLGSWFLLMIISYTLVSLVNRPRAMDASCDRLSYRRRMQAPQQSRDAFVIRRMVASRPEGRLKDKRLAHQGRKQMLRLAAISLVVLVTTILSSTAFAQSAQPNRTVLKTADLTGTDKEIIIAVLEVPPGAFIARHTHPGEEAVYVLEGATLQTPDGKEVVRPAGQAGVNVRDVPHAGYKVIGDKVLKLLTVHVVDKGKPMTVSAP